MWRGRTCKDNHFAGGSVVASVQEWEKVIMTADTFHGLQNLLALPQGVQPSAYEWDNNTYVTGGAAAPFSFQGPALYFAGWKKATGFDGSRTCHGSRNAVVRRSGI